MKNKVFLGCVAAALLPLAGQGQTVDTLVNTGLLEPHSIAYHTNTTFYVTDSATHRVLTYDSDNGLLTTLAGVSGQGGTNNGPGFIARFTSPRGLIVARGGLIVADTGNHSLRFLTLPVLSGAGVAVVTHFAGAPGQPGYVDGPLVNARFNTPSALAVDATGNLFVADSKNNVIRKIDLANNVSTFATGFFEPSGLAFDHDGNLLVADTRNHAIKLVSPAGVVSHFAGSTDKVAGATDSYFAEESLFNQPSSLIWLPGNNGLLVTDTGNHTLRRVYYDPIIAGFFPDLSGYSVQTYAGTARVPGLQDGVLSAARFNSPVGLTRDAEGGVLVTDLGNRAIRRLQITPKLPPVSEPRIGYVTFVEDERTGEIRSKLITFSDATFFTEPIIAVASDANTQTIYTLGSSPGLFSEDTIPAPNAQNSQPVPPYSDGLAPSQVKPSIITPRSDMPDITLKVVSTAEGRRPSPIVKARIVFKVAPVSILGDNPASFQVTSDTPGAEIWYTTDDTMPTNAPPSIPADTATLSIIANAPFTFRARAFREGFKPSDIATKAFSPTEFKANRISFGFERGEASSDFVASPGQTFYAPVTLSLLPGTKMYSLQFNVTVTHLGTAPPIMGANQFGFESTLMENIPPGSGIYRVIPPAMFANFATNPPPESNLVNRDGVPFSSLLFTNTTDNLLGVGWLARGGITNEPLFNVINQDLITFSQPHDTLFLKTGGKVVVGAYKFVVPPNAAQGDKYRITLGRASATSDGIGGPNSDVYIDIPTGGSLTAGTINAVKEVTVGQRGYIVGDAAPFKWFNAGDFGNESLLSDDVMQVYQTAVYGLNAPIPGSDFFDAMDSCCDTVIDVNDLFQGDNTTINTIRFGDGRLDVADVYVSFRRSLDPSLTWYYRFWDNGVRVAQPRANLFRGKPNLPAEELSNAFALPLLESDAPPSVRVSAPDYTVAGGEELRIPLRVQIHGAYPLRTLLFNVQVEALDGSPAVVEQVHFEPSPGLGAPTLNTSRGLGNYSAAWLNRATPGLAGDTTLGVLRVRVPAGLNAKDAYRVRFAHFSGSPNGLAVFPQSVQDGLLLTTARDHSSFGDRIPDTWRLRYFGSVANHLSHEQADADGDGMNNLDEFKAGTNPVDLHSQFRVAMATGAGGSTGQAVVLRWPSAAGKSYTIESSTGIIGAGWIPVAESVPGTGLEMQHTVREEGAAMRFYRVRIVE